VPQLRALGQRLVLVPLPALAWLRALGQRLVLMPLPLPEARPWPSRKQESRRQGD
jgi:hypothetical protein